MALSQKALQHKRQKKKKKRIVRKIVQPISPTVTYYHWPIYECWMPIRLWDIGIGSVVISRQRDPRNIAVGVYLIDVFCLGVKNCFVRLVEEDEYYDMLDCIEETCGEMKNIQASYANTLIHQATCYAQQFCFEPHPDFEKIKAFLKGIPLDETQKFTFGKEGHPFYVQGPYDSRADVKRIIRVLEAQCKKEKITYDFICEAGASE
jgi:hypothetical protein